jgi:hypothetical protein
MAFFVASNAITAALFLLVDTIKSWLSNVFIFQSIMSYMFIHNIISQRKLAHAFVIVELSHVYP